MTPAINQIDVRIGDLNRQIRDLKQLKKKLLKQLYRPALKLAWEGYAFKTWVFAMMLVAFPLWVALGMLKGWFH